MDIQNNSIEQFWEQWQMDLVVQLSDKERNMAIFNVHSSYVQDMLLMKFKVLGNPFQRLN